MPGSEPASTVAFEIAGYISPNPSPEVLIACGPDDEIAEFADRIGKIASADIVARASDGTTAFLKAHLHEMRYREFIELMVSCPPHIDIPFVRRVSPSIGNGRLEDVGNPHAPPVIVGILADPQSLATIVSHLSWAKCESLDLRFEGRGVFFEPDDGNFEAYEAFVRDAAAGYYANAVIVLLRRRA